MTAADVLRSLTGRGWTLAVAESLTGGLLAAEFVAVPGASATLVGGVLAYATKVKADILGVDPRALAATGPVDETVATMMAGGVARLLHADVGLATTGVAGPGGHGGLPAGTVVVAASLPDGRTQARRLLLPGNRDDVRRASVLEAVALLEGLLAEQP